MSPELLRQGAQLRRDGYSIGFIGTTLRASSDGGGPAVRLGIAGGSERRSVELATGESAPLPGGGAVRVVEIFFSPDGSESAAAIEVVRA